MKRIRFYCKRLKESLVTEYPDDVADEEIDEDFRVWFEKTAGAHWRELETGEE